MWRFFVDHSDAGRALARALADQVRPGTIVLGMPSGGLAVGETVARTLGLRFAPWIADSGEVAGHTAIIVDDGHGPTTAIAGAVRDARARCARKVIVALPVAAPADVEALEDVAHDVVCPIQLAA